MSAALTAEALRAERRPYVRATVVRAEKPTSAHAGDSALVLDDGTVVGFVGGECAASSVQAHALAALDTGEPVLLRITPEPSAAESAQAGTISVHNPCLSGGTLEVFLEPWVPPALVVVHGDAPIARAMRELAEWLGFDARAPDVGGDAVPSGTAAVVVASHGGDEHAVLAAALAADVPYVGLIASKRRGAAVVATLEPEVATRVRTPAGVDIGARTPQEVALSVLAEVVSVRPRPSPRPPAEAPPQAATATDPVCGMSVAMVESSRRIEREGVTYWFCGSGCEAAFRSR